MIQADAAISHYQRLIRPNPGFEPERGNPALVGWLENSVAPIVEHWLVDNRFRQMATFSLNRLARPNDSEEHAALQAVHSGLTGLASSIQILLEQPAVRQVLLQLPGYRRWAARYFGDSPETWITSTLSCLNSIRQLPLSSFVSENDFFSPTAGLYADEEPRIQLSHLRTKSKSQLSLPGDMIFGCLKVRLEFFSDELHRLRNSLTSLPESFSNSDLVENVTNQSTAYYGAEQIFFQTVQLSKEWQKCDSAVTLLQAYSFARKHNMRDWLGLNSNAQTSHHSFYHEIHRVGGIAVANQVLAALENTKKVLELPKSREELMDEYVAKYRIVMTDGGGTIYFDSEVIIDHGIACHTDKHVGTAQLELLQTLIESALTGDAVSSLDLSAFRSPGNGSKPGFTLGNATPKAIRDRRSKLKNSIPPELNDLIESEAGEYRLTLNPNEIYILHPEDQGDFRG